MSNKEVSDGYYTLGLHSANLVIGDSNGGGMGGYVASPYAELRPMDGEVG